VVQSLKQLLLDSPDRTKIHLKNDEESRATTPLSAEPSELILKFLKLPILHNIECLMYVLIPTSKVFPFPRLCSYINFLLEVLCDTSLLQIFNHKASREILELLDSHPATPWTGTMRNRKSRVIVMGAHLGHSEFRTSRLDFERGVVHRRPEAASILYFTS
jgi:hypothetical protein